jgi:hypothetical protein
MPKADAPSSTGYAAAALALMCEERALRAVAAVESGALGAFLETDEPVILYERHLFSRFTHGKFDGHALPPNFPMAWGVLSDPRPGGYGPPTVQHRKLEAACAMNRDAALRATSWGAFQILGDNFLVCGYLTLQAFVNAMYRSADDHLIALACFIKSDHRQVDAIRSRDWTSFARLYNGPAFARNQYDVKLATAYRRLAP